MNSNKYDLQLKINGKLLSEEQLTVVIPLLNHYHEYQVRWNVFCDACERATKKANCPITPETQYAESDPEPRAAYERQGSLESS